MSTIPNREHEELLRRHGADLIWFVAVEVDAATPPSRISEVPAQGRAEPVAESVPPVSVPSGAGGGKEQIFRSTRDWIWAAIYERVENNRSAAEELARQVIALGGNGQIRYYQRLFRRIYDGIYESDQTARVASARLALVLAGEPQASADRMIGLYDWVFLQLYKRSRPQRETAIHLARELAKCGDAAAVDRFKQLCMKAIREHSLAVPEAVAWARNQVSL